MALKFLLEALTLTMIIAVSTIASGEDSSITLPLEDGETYHSILPISGETANPYRLAVIGDSVAWGNGLNQEHKYYNLVAEWLRTNLGKPVEVIIYAHSGAVISGTSDESAKDANLNSGYPSLMDQAKNVPNDVDLILVSGGINDVGIANILDPKTSEDTIKSRSEDIQEPMKELLTYLVDNTKPDAKIIVTGYYPLITDDSKLGLKDRAAGALLARGSEESVSQEVINLAASEANPSLGSAVSTWQSAKEFGINLENLIENDALFKANSYTFYSASSDSLRAAVNDVNKAIGRNRVAFVDPLFQSNNGYRASESYLWEFEPGLSIESNDEQYDERSKLTNPLDFENKDNALGHPNVKGASRYADIINASLKSKIFDWFQSATVNKKSTSAALERWNKTFGKSVLYSVQQTSDGGYVATGYRDIRDNYQDVLLIKTDEAGNELLNKTFSVYHMNWGSSIQQTNDGGYIIAGGTIEDSLKYCCQYRALLIKTDTNGNLLWDKTFKCDNGAAGLVYSVQPTIDGGYILAGNSPYGAWLIKTDSNGNEVWNHDLSGSYFGAMCCAKSVLPTFDGGYILAGDSWYTNDAILIKTEGNGEKVWEKASDRPFGGYGCAGAFSIRPTNDKGYIIAGKTEGTSNYHNNNIHISPEQSFAYGATGYAWLIKADIDGNMIWNKTYSMGYENHSGAYSVQQTSDGGYIFAGMTGLGFLDHYDAWLVKTDGEGYMLWNRTFGGTFFDEVYSVQQTNDGGYIIAGTNDGSAWLIKTDVDGYV